MTPSQALKLLFLHVIFAFVFFFSSRRRHTRCSRDWSSDVCSSDLRFCRRAVRNDGTNNYAAFGGKLQLLGGFARDFVKFHAEPAGVLPVEQSHRSVVVTGQRRESFELIDGLAVFGESHLRGNERVEFRRLLVAPREFCLQLLEFPLQPRERRFLGTSGLRVGRGGGQSDERQPECRDSSGNPKIACVHLRPFLLALRRGRGEIVRRSSAAQSNGFPHSPCGGEWELRPRPVCRAFLADAGCSPWLWGVRNRSFHSGILLRFRPAGRTAPR